MGIPNEMHCGSWSEEQPIVPSQSVPTVGVQFPSVFIVCFFKAALAKLHLGPGHQIVHPNGEIIIVVPLEDFHSPFTRIIVKFMET